jgi:SAM-dependent methyltransferase
MLAMTSAPPDPSAILQLGFAFFPSRTLLAAVELGVFTELAKGPRTLEQLRLGLGLNGRGAGDFFDGLVALEMLTRDDTGRYANTVATGMFLDRAKPSYIGGIFEMMSRRLFGFWAALPEALRTGEHQNEARHGVDMFAELYAVPQRLEGFLAAMSGMSQGIAQAIAQKFPWDRYGSVVDIGCAQGCVPVTIARAHPHLAGGGFDLPAVRPIFERYVAGHGLSQRLEFHAGDFFRDALPAADVLVMGHILHDWDLEAKRRLVRAAYAALPPGGALIVYDMMIDDARRENVMGLMMSLNMLIETAGGFDYTGAECRAWLSEAGFEQVRTEHLVGPHSMTTGVKAA